LVTYFFCFFILKSSKHKTSILSIKIDIENKP
jgi:hypothetical protein